MMAGNPNWCWSMLMNDMHPHESHQISSDSPPSSNTNVSSQFPLTSWSQLLLGGLVDGEEEEEEERLINRKFENNNWEEQQVLQNSSNFTRIINSNNNNYYYYDNNNNNHVLDVKQEQLVSQLTTNGGSGQLDDDDDREILLLSNFSNNNNNYFFNFSGGGKKAAAAAEEKSSVHHHNHQDHRSSHEGNSTSSTGVASKKARVHQSSAQPALKVRKEKLGDRITALHQLVSPFGKTDTASVLSEAIANIRFLQARIQALSFPYMRNAPTVNITGQHIHQHSVQERNCIIQEDAADQASQSREAKDLRSRGLCLVPISCTENIGNDNSADYWPPSPIGGGF